MTGVDIFVLSGGGGTGSVYDDEYTTGSAGGGSGNYNLASSQTLTAQSYTVTIGAGGAGTTLAAWSGAYAGDGNSSVFYNTTVNSSSNAGSRETSIPDGTQPPSSNWTGGSNSLYAGGTGVALELGVAGGGAGLGGDGQAGIYDDVNYNWATGGNGGVGYNLFSLGTYYGGGGGGGGARSDATYSIGGVGGSGGGGRGGGLGYTGNEGTDGAANTGGGGGGGYSNSTTQNGKNGGSGVVIVRYPV